jgi:iron complex outermembrane receptor protein
MESSESGGIGNGLGGFSKRRKKFTFLVYKFYKLTLLIMNRFYCTLVFYWFALCYLSELGAQITVSGKIVDASGGGALPGVSISVKGTVQRTISNDDGQFVLELSGEGAVSLEIEYIGYLKQEIALEDPRVPLTIALQERVSEFKDAVVVTASRVSERILESPVTIEKLDLATLKSLAAPTFFDALEQMKGVQMTTVSMGFKVPNTRGFSGTTNSRFLQMVDGADVQSPGIGAPVANAVGPTELDIASVELIPGAASALYGMNATNGVSSLMTKSPYVHKGLSLYHRLGINHVDGRDAHPQLFQETALRYAQTLGKGWAFKANISYFNGYDWVAHDTTDLRPGVNGREGLWGENNPGRDPINAYGNENQNRKDLLMANGKTYQVARTGYFERDFMDYRTDNLKADASLHYRFGDDNEISYTFRAGKADNVYQRGNRIRLDDLLILQHKLDFRGKRFSGRIYHTTERTGDSWNARPMAENLDRSFKTDQVWFQDYRNAFNEALSGGSDEIGAHAAAREQADSGRYLPGTPEFGAKVSELAQINNWDQGAALKLATQFVHGEGQYELTDHLRWIEAQAGFDFRTFIVTPDGNSFVNPNGLYDAEQVGKDFAYSKVGGFLQVSKRFWRDRIRLMASVRADKQQYFEAKLNPRFALVVNAAKNHFVRASWQNGFRFPTLFEGFSFVDNGGVKRLGGLEVLGGGLNIHGNSYLRSTVSSFNNAVRASMNQGLTEGEAIEANKGLLKQSEYGFIKPERIQSIEVGYKTVVFGERLFLDVDYYYSRYEDFIGQVEVTRINRGTIGLDDSTAYFARTSGAYANNTTFRLWTNSTGAVTNHGGSLGLNYRINRHFDVGGNVSWAKLVAEEEGDGLIPAFNTPEFIANVSVSAKELLGRFGFRVNWHWQSAFKWDSPLAAGIVPAYNTFDAQVSVGIPEAKLNLKLGATNLVNQRYTQYVGGPTIGGMYYLALVFGPIP